MSAGFQKAFARAKSSEDSNLVEFAAHLREATERARRAQQFFPLFALRWTRLLKFYLATFDLDSANKVMLRARRWRLPGSGKKEFEFKDLLDGIAPIRAVVDKARKELSAIAAGEDRKFKPGQIALFVPASALAFSGQNQVFSDLRKIVETTAASFEAAGLPYAIFARLNNHGTPLVPDSVQYISHHTMSPKTNGLHYKVTDRPHCFSFDRKGYSGWSIFADIQASDIANVDQAAADEMIETDRAAVIGGNISKYAQAHPEQIDDGPWIFIALQTVNDAVQKHARISMLDMLDDVARTGQEKCIKVVVKRHPRCTDKRVEAALRRGVRDGCFEVSKASIHSLIAGSCAVCTVNSSVGAEALLHSKPVYLFGRAEYQYACYQIQSRGEFGRVFAPDRLPVSADEIRRFLFLFRTVYAHDISSASFPAFLAKKLSELQDVNIPG